MHFHFLAVFRAAFLSPPNKMINTYNAKYLLFQIGLVVGIYIVVFT